MAKTKQEELYSLQEVQNELRDEIGVELSIEEIADVCRSPLVAAAFAFNRGVDVRLPLWGVLMRKHRYVIGLKQKALTEMKGLIPSGEYKKLESELKTAHKRKISEIPKTEYEELLALPKIHRVNQKYDKLVENQTYVPLKYYYDEETGEFKQIKDE